nr:immunoglobulin light chain junction region [Macaca mulatta]MOW41618.1 immunoglobulin light chain junction region [Macaca mulatta]MOW41757.1 immunoglobulin light chain junction region [Macaca mulatta]MOW41801.1 immunoglobulin light chain junction region [Macaca mulatta]MOW42380.1 immunoglobulin light chain junction region [Macaca mulatta]
CGQGSHLPPTF